MILYARADLGHLVRPPQVPHPWLPPGIPPIPPYEPDADPLILPDSATLQRALEGLRRLWRHA